MKLNSKGQVTIPADLRHKYGFSEGDDVEIVEVGGALQIAHSADSDRRGKRLTRRMRGRATTAMSTDELMELFRGE